MKNESEKIKSLTAKQHILLRPAMYLGGMNPADINAWILDENENISFTKINYTEGLLKICNEAIDNAIDEHIKTSGEFSTKISVDITKDTFTVKDNGRGISTEKDENGEPAVVRAVTVPMSGSNFEEDNEAVRKSIGMNGLGIKGAAIFSKSFECVTCDGKNTVKVIGKDNLSSVTYKVTKAYPKRGTTVTFSPDFARFGVKSFDEKITSLIKTRLRFLAWFFPKCQITLNGEKVGVRVKDIASMFPQPSVVLSTDNVYICVYPSDEPYALSYVNGISLRDCGTHVDYILSKIIYDIREKVSKKYKSIKPADIRNRLGIVVFFKDFSSCKFNSQTKESLTNSQAEVTEYLRNNNIDLDAFTSKIIHTKPIIENIVDLFRLKEELAERKQLAALSKTKKEVVSEKYFAPIAKSGQKYLMITEGQSAFSGISPILGRKGIGYYMLRGKPLNILDVKATGKKGFMENQEISELVNILGLDLNGNTEDMTYDYVVILSDADPDGTAIAGLATTMFSKLAPKMIKAGRICRLNTPLLIGLKNSTVEEYYFQFPNEKDLKKNLKYFYLKGLGSWTKDRLNQVIEKEGGMDKLLMPFEMDEKAVESINNWFGIATVERKIALRGREFHINNA